MRSNLTIIVLSSVLFATPASAMSFGEFLDHMATDAAAIFNGESPSRDPMQGTDAENGPNGDENGKNGESNGSDATVDNNSVHASTGQANVSVSEGSVEASTNGASVSVSGNSITASANGASVSIGNSGEK